MTPLHYIIHFFLKKNPSHRVDPTVWVKAVSGARLGLGALNCKLH